MLVKILGLIQAWDDAEKQKAIFAPDERLFSIEAEGYNDCIASQFSLRVVDPPVEVSRGTLVSIRAVLIICEGLSGIDVIINGADEPRQLCPPFEDVDASEGTPRAYYLETCDDLSATIPLIISHGEPNNEDALPVLVRYILIGDQTAGAVS